MSVYKPTQEELDNFDIRSKYCQEAAAERRYLANHRNMVNRYSSVGFDFDEEYTKRKDAYLDKFVYFEQNTIRIIEEKEKEGKKPSWGNYIFSKKEVEDKIKEIEG